MTTTTQCYGPKMLQCHAVPRCSLNLSWGFSKRTCVSQRFGCRVEAVKWTTCSWPHVYIYNMN